LFEDFRRSIREGDYVSDQTLDAILCIETIGAAYESASLGSREVAIPGQRVGPAYGRLAAAGGKVAHGTLG